MVSLGDPTIYFGNLRSAGFVFAPSTANADPVGAIDGFGYSNGGAFVTQSGATHRVFSMNWNTAQIDDLQFLFNYRNGLYGSGLLYWVDIYAAYYNALSPHWAAPFLSANGWPSLYGADNLPVQVAATSTLNGQPIYSAKYTISGAADAVPDRGQVLLIPPTHQLSVGFSGSATNGGVVRVQPYNRDGSLAATQDFTLLSASGTTRMNKTFSGATYSAVKIYITSSISGTATLTLDSGDAIYTLLTGTPVLTGNHNEGRGHTGLRFKSDPTLAYKFYDDGGVAPRRYVSVAVDLEEIGGWL